MKKSKRVGQSQQDMSGSEFTGRFDGVKSGKESGRTQTGSVSVNTSLKTGAPGGRGGSMKSPGGASQKYEHTKQVGNLGTGKA